MVIEIDMTRARQSGLNFSNLVDYFNRAENDFINGSIKLPKKLLFWGAEIEQFDPNNSRTTERRGSYMGLPKGVPEAVKARSLANGIGHRDGSGPWEIVIPHGNYLRQVIKKFNETVGDNFWCWHNQGGNYGCGSHIHLSVAGNLTRPSLDGQKFGLVSWWTQAWNNLVTLVPLCLPVFTFGSQARSALFRWAKVVKKRLSVNTMAEILCSLRSPVMTGEWKHIAHDYGAIVFNRNQKRAITIELRLNENHPYWWAGWGQWFGVVTRRSIANGLSVKLLNHSQVTQTIWDQFKRTMNPYKALENSGPIEFIRGREPFMMHKGRIYANGLEFFREFCLAHTRFYHSYTSPIFRNESLECYSRFVKLEKLPPELIWKPDRAVEFLNTRSDINNYIYTPRDPLPEEPIRRNGRSGSSTSSAPATTTTPEPETTVEIGEGGVGLGEVPRPRVPARGGIVLDPRGVPRTFPALVRDGDQVSAARIARNRNDDELVEEVRLGRATSNADGGIRTTFSDIENVEIRHSLASLWNRLRTHCANIMQEGALLRHLEAAAGDLLMLDTLTIEFDDEVVMSVERPLGLNTDSLVQAVVDFFNLHFGEHDERRELLPRGRGNMTRYTFRFGVFGDGVRIPGRL